MHWSEWSWWGWTVMTIAMVAFWGLVAWVVIWVIRSAGPELPPERTAETVLGDRLAAGEIDETEYRSRLETLRSTTTDRA